MLDIVARASTRLFGKAAGDRDSHGIAVDFHVVVTWHVDGFAQLARIDGILDGERSYRTCRNGMFVPRAWPLLHEQI